MPTVGLSDAWPLWGVFLGITALILVWREAGRWLGLYRRRSAADGTLDFVLAVGMGVIGYHVENAATGRSPAILTFAAVTTLIADLDHPYPLIEFCGISPQSLMDLRWSLGQDDRRGIP